MAGWMSCLPTPASTREVGFIGGWPGSERPRVPEGALENYLDERWNRLIEINLNGVFATSGRCASHETEEIRTHHYHDFRGVTRIEPAIGAAVYDRQGRAAALCDVSPGTCGVRQSMSMRLRPGTCHEYRRRPRAQSVEQKAVASTVPMHRVGFPADMQGLALFSHPMHRLHHGSGSRRGRRTAPRTRGLKLVGDLHLLGGIGFCNRNRLSKTDFRF